jgi:hypothetical protein
MKGADYTINEEVITNQFYGSNTHIFVASLDETEMISYDTQCASAATADTLK